MATTELPLSYVEIALGGKTPRLYRLSDGNIITEKESQTSTSAKMIYSEPVYFDEDNITADTPFQYHLESAGCAQKKTTIGDIADGYQETIVLKAHTPATLEKYLSDVRMTLSQDLIRNGIPIINFDPIIKYIFQKKTYLFHIEDLQVFRLMRFPQQVDFFDPGQRPELLNLAQNPLFIPCRCNGRFVLFKAQHRAGKDLFQKYVSTVKKYRETLSMLLQTIDEWSFNGTQSPRNLWVTIYGTPNQYGVIERVKL